MKFEPVTIPAGAENADSTALMIAAGLAVAAALVLVSAPRLFASLAVLCGAVAGAVMMA